MIPSSPRPLPLEGERIGEGVVLFLKGEGAVGQGEFFRGRVFSSSQTPGIICLMKKTLKVIFFILIILAAFWAGTGLKQNKDIKTDTSVGKTQSGKHAEGVVEDFSSMTPGAVKITTDRQQKIGVRVEAVEKKSVSHIVRVLGRVEADETKIYRINASVDGWIAEHLEVVSKPHFLSFWSKVHNNGFSWCFEMTSNK